MSKSERDTSIPLPAPISLTLEEAMQVAGGFANQFAHDVIINGIPNEYWILSNTLTSGLQTAVGQTISR